MRRFWNPAPQARSGGPLGEDGATMIRTDGRKTPHILVLTVPAGFPAAGPLAIIAPP